MRNNCFLYLCLGLFLFSCSESKKEQTTVFDKQPVRAEQSTDVSPASVSDTGVVPVSSTDRNSSVNALNKKELTIYYGKVSEFAAASKADLTAHCASLHIPAKAVAEGTALRIEALQKGDLPPLDAGLTNTTTLEGGFRFLPAGTQFAKPVTVAISYDTTLIPEGYTEKDLRTFYYDTQSQNWVMLPRDTVKDGQLLSLTTHFTDMITGILKVPETPVTSAYVPTTMSDIKAANPSLNIKQLQAPQPNAQGNADLQYPLDFPSGRQGMMPSLNFSYSSGGGESWLGVGWNLSAPSIEIETRWGMPQFLPDRESETYVMQGGQLAPVAHRSEYEARTAEKQFYPRAEGAFNRIIRHGNSPKNYWWEITTTTGKRHFYGGTPDGSLDETALLRDRDGNICRWHLTEERDLNDNFVHYYYDKKSSEFKTTGEQAVSHRIKRINYTGHGTEAGVYDVMFITDTELGQPLVRTRKLLSARQGYLSLNEETLRRIEITFRGEKMRSYELNYTDGAFEQKLLEKIDTYDKDDALFYSHRFDYYNDIQNDFFGAEQHFTPPSEDLNANFINPIPAFGDHVSAIGGTKSWGFNIGGSVGVGPNVGMFKEFTVSGTYNFSYSDTEGIATLMDLNGDGLPDKVYKKGGSLFYRPGAGTAQVFGEEVRLQGAPSDFSHTKSTTNSAGINASFYIMGGYNKSWTTSRTDIFISDFNSDGLPDIAAKGKVYFNVLRNGHPTFETTSDNTFNPIRALGAIDESLFPDPVALTAEQARQNPLHNAVRMWTAPYTGRITIDAPATLLAPTTDDEQTDGYEKRDGVRVSVQRENTLLWNNIIDKDNHDTVPYKQNNVSVNKGERLFFRVQSITNGVADRVAWNPEISYTEIAGNANDTLLKSVDVNRRAYTQFKASEDFTLFEDKSVPFPKKGAVLLETTIEKAALSDTLRMQIFYKKDTLTTEILFDEKTFLPEETVNTTYNYTAEVEGSGQFRFAFATNSAVDWAKVKGWARLTYTRIDDAQNTPVTRRDGKPQYEFFGLFGANMYHRTERIALPYRNETSGEQRLRIAPVVKIGATNDDTLRLNNSTFLFTLKSRTQVFGQTMVSFSIDKNTRGVKGYLETAEKPVYTVRLAAGDTLFAEYRAFCEETAGNLQAANCLIGRENENDTVFAGASVYLPSAGDAIRRDRDAAATEQCNANYDNMPWWGRLYRGWGQFTYNEQDIYSTATMDLAAMNADINKLRNPDLGDEEEFKKGLTDEQIRELDAKMYKPETARYLLMTANGERLRYEGMTSTCFVDGEGKGSSRFGMQDVVVEPFVAATGGFPAITKINKTESGTASLGISFGIAGGSFCWTNGEAKFDVDMIDMNGDGYPDIYNKNKVQFTGSLGGITQNRAQNFQELVAKTEGRTMSTGGGYGQPPKLGTLFSKSKKADDAGKQASTSVSISGSMGVSYEEAQVEWIDVNGDGLPDRVYSNGDVELNMGYRFANRTAWGLHLTEGKTRDYGAGLGVSLYNGSITAGISLSRSENQGVYTMIDVNGDGLPDRVRAKGYAGKDDTDMFDDYTDVYVAYNRGTEFAPEIEYKGFNPMPKGLGTGESVNGGGSYPIPVWLIKIVLGIDAGAQHGVSRERRSFQDMNGDGYPDWVYSDTENELRVRYAQPGRLNLLKSVACPMGAQYFIDYTQTRPSQADPHARWTMSSLQVFDGLAGDGVDTLRRRFEYAAPKYDRYERTFLGFGQVVSHELGEFERIYRSRTQTFGNEHIYEQGLLKEEKMQAGDGRLLSKTTNHFAWVEPETGTASGYSRFFSGRLWGRLQSSETVKYEGSESVAVQKQYEYDRFGNATIYQESTPTDGLQVEVEYIHNNEKYLHALPTAFRLMSEGQTLRERFATYDTRGNLTRLSQNAGERLVSTDLEVDGFGNITKVTRPANYRGQRLWYEFTYDDVHHDLVLRTADAYGYSSSTEYDAMWKVPLKTTDLNGEVMRYAYDNRGRLRSVASPYDSLGRSEIEFSYFPAEKYAKTVYHLAEGDVETYSFMDGLERIVQVKKTAVIDPTPTPTHEGGAADASSTVKVMQVSGAVLYDTLGRAVKQFLPFAEELGAETVLNFDNPLADLFTTTDYDVEDRVVKQTLPDGSPTTIEYAIEGGLAVDAITDAEGKTIKLWKTVREQKVRQQQEEAVTQFRYNVLSEVLETTDPKGNRTTYEYDMLGRLVKNVHPDAGTTEAVYDDAGNLVRKITDNIKNFRLPPAPSEGGGDGSGEESASAAGIVYTYNFEQPFEVIYPKNVQNRVTYTFGKAGEKNGRAGRLALVQDASGGQEFFYGRLGETVKTVRSVMTSTTDVYTYIWEGRYDAFGRAREMTYPDGEKVTYNYNDAGELINFAGVKDGFTYEYIAENRYDIFGHLTYQKMGNGTEHFYTYDPARQRLSEMQLLAGGTELMRNVYAYDRVDNILSITNAETSHEYGYDRMNRLVSARGASRGQTYSLDMTYDLMGNILRKNQVSSNAAIAHDLTYEYGSAKPNAATKIGNKIYTYDANGNPTFVEDGDKYRRMIWDEDNRLQTIDDNQYISRYVYDHAGERVVKTHGESSEVLINGAAVGRLTANENTSWYVSPYFTVGKNGREFTKHYYAGSQRVASKLGNGHFNNAFRHGVFGLTAGTIDYIDRMRQLQGVKQQVYSKLPPGVPHAKGIYAEPEQSGYAYPDGGTPENNFVPAGYPRKPISMYERDRDKAPGVPVIYGESVTNETASGGFGFESEPALEVNVFFYHSDHLGSTAYVTTGVGKVSQFVVYLPFGETLVEEHSNTRDMPYFFNAKERDSETGLYYYGARYYDPQVALWLGCDPLRDKKLHVSSYGYCLGNPVRFIDPDGLDEWELNGKGEVTKHTKTKKHDAFFIVDENGKRQKDTDGNDISVKFKYGTVEKYGTNDKKHSNYDYYRVRGDENGTELFEFVAKNTKVEWSHAMFGIEGSKGLNYLITSHDETSEKGIAHMFNKQFHSDYSFRKHIHNHFGDDDYPSGSFDHPIKGKTGEYGDIKMAKGIETWNSFKYPERKETLFFLYMPTTNKYIQYYTNSVYADFKR